MSQAEELLNSLDASNVSEESHIVIGKDRFITVPDTLKRLAVQYDHDIETVTFDCPRYWDEHDMSIMTVYINYLCPDGTNGIYKANNLRIDEADQSIMHFDWTISRNITNADGHLTFLVCIKSTDSDGIEKNHWNSELCNDCYISKGLEYDEEELRELVPDIIEQWHREVLAVTDEIKEARRNGEFKGDPGISPTIKVVDINKGHRVEITDINGTKSFDVLGTIVDGTEAVNKLLNQFVYKSKVFYADSTDGKVYEVSSTDVDAIDGAKYVIRVNMTNIDGEPILLLRDGSTAIIRPKIAGSNSPIYGSKEWIDPSVPLEIMYDEDEGQWIADVDFPLGDELIGIVPPEKGGTGADSLDKIWKKSYTYSMVHSDNSITEDEVNKTLDSARPFGKYIIEYDRYEHSHPNSDIEAEFPFKNGWDYCTLIIENAIGNGRKSINDLPDNNVRLFTTQTIKSNSGEEYIRNVDYKKDGSLVYNSGWIEKYNSASTIPVSKISGIDFNKIRCGNDLPQDSDCSDGDIFVLVTGENGVLNSARLYIWLQDYNGWHIIN